MIELSSDLAFMASQARVQSPASVQSPARVQNPASVASLAKCHMPHLLQGLCFARGVQKVICLQEEALDEVFEVGQQFDEGSLTITMTIFLIILKSVILGAVDESQQRFL